MTFWLLVVLLFMGGRLRDAYTSEYAYIQLPAIALQGATPAGEIVEGFRLEQPVNWKLLREGTSGDEEVAPCVSILLANYHDRENRGSIAISLDAGGELYRHTVEVNAVRDNAFHRVCYENVKLKDIVNRPASVILEGVDGRPGSAVTAWLSRSKMERGVLEDGEQSEMALVFRIETLRASGWKLAATVVLSIFAGASALLIIFSSYTFRGFEGRGDEERPFSLKSLV